ncbi:ribonuclease inhibitor-like [Pangasianodon hypophthalmus]|uniref:ribonuclease inhibitor-like n=1 Tax=Pangasianodon hypophthalmus TaxID=310915 RepID=UPI0023073D8D|nr:ribonuclease inhibitor-like [Pangasianodon hypophthalmus]
MGFSCRIPCVKPLLNNRQRQKRLAWANDKKDWTAAEWSKVILSLCRLCDCGVSDEGCAALTSALRSNPSHLRELDLSGNKLRDSGVKCLSAVLENPHCKLETLRLCDCGFSDEGCDALTSALRSNPSHLRELDLSGNELGDSGVKRLSAVLENPHCKLETLR